MMEIPKIKKSAMYNIEVDKSDASQSISINSIDKNRPILEESMLVDDKMLKTSSKLGDNSKEIQFSDCNNSKIEKTS